MSSRHTSPEAKILESPIGFFRTVAVRQESPGSRRVRSSCNQGNKTSGNGLPSPWRDKVLPDLAGIASQLAEQALVEG
jgi:hypothetical protein